MFGFKPSQLHLFILGALILATFKYKEDQKNIFASGPIFIKSDLCRHIILIYTTRVNIMVEIFGNMFSIAKVLIC